MPKLINRNPKLSKLKKYAVVYYHGKIIYLGDYCTPEALVAYNRFCAEIQGNPALCPPKAEEPDVTVPELTAAYLDYAKANTDPTIYGIYRTIVLDFLDKLYGDNTSVNDFKPSCLKLVRESMVQSRRFCRNTVNRHTQRIVSLFEWGVENELVLETTWRTLQAVKSLPDGAPGTFDHPEREEVPDNVIKATLPFMPPMLRAMVKIQRLTGMRPGEVFRMRVGDIDRSRGNGLWYYIPGSYKTSEFVGKIVFPLGKPEQELLAPYLEGKTGVQAVFSPRTAQAERNAVKRANRKTKLTPLQMAREEARTAKPYRYSEFYNRFSYRQAIEHAINKGNKTLPESEQIPYWTPYRLRNSAATATEENIGLDEAQAQLGHKSANMTRRYSKAQLRIREKLARDRQQQNPFDDGLEGERAAG
ncbi:MAG: site-specific integrase [Planctomycetaceae bacterium]|jgi:integrase|nr:site-specific integrase [Planctomycetaceae bacterium]